MLPQALSYINIREAMDNDRERVIALVSAMLTEYGLAADLETTDSELDLKQTSGGQPSLHSIRLQAGAF